MSGIRLLAITNMENHSLYTCNFISVLIACCYTYFCFYDFQLFNFLCTAKLIILCIIANVCFNSSLFVILAPSFLCCLKTLACHAEIDEVWQIDWPCANRGTAVSVSCGVNFIGKSVSVQLSETKGMII